MAIRVYPLNPLTTGSYGLRCNEGNVAELVTAAVIALLFAFAVALDNGMQGRTVQSRKNRPPNPRRKTTAWRKESRNIAEIFGGFEQSDTGESCGVEMAERVPVSPL